MIVVDDNQIVFFDCDDTLVIWGYDRANTSHTDNLVEFNNWGYSQWLLPNQELIDQLKGHKKNGHKVVVWSRSGYEWAKEIVEGLKLQDHVDFVMSKPMYFYDDLPASQFMDEFIRIYSNPITGERRGF